MISKFGQIYYPVLVLVAVFAPLTPIITTVFECTDMPQNNNVFYNPDDFPSSEGFKFGKFTVDYQIAPFTHYISLL